MLTAMAEQWKFYLDAAKKLTIVLIVDFHSSSTGNPLDPSDFLSPGRSIDSLIDVVVEKMGFNTPSRLQVMVDADTEGPNCGESVRYKHLGRSVQSLFLERGRESDD
jgi:hypothetical protein